MIEDYLMMQGIVRSNPEWQEAVKKRGITDFKKVQIDPWSAGHFGFPEEKGVRVFRAVSYYKGDSKNYYARPIEGVVAYVDLNAKRIIKVVDSGVVPMAKASADYHPAAVGKMREAPKPYGRGQRGPQWTSADRAIENRDIVLWHTMGLTHIPRPEEWPVMTCHRAGFKLLPNGFFTRNPALDVPRTQ
ncbi:MAG TPA: hypothetical protein VKA70_01550 [Blastocatellia bacterium]|nr:hypothetical protein [Blastocatellia bacterium]